MTNFRMSSEVWGRGGEGGPRLSPTRGVDLPSPFRPAGCASRAFFFPPGLFDIRKFGIRPSLQIYGSNSSFEHCTMGRISCPKCPYEVG